MDDSTQNTIPWLRSDIHRLVREANEHFVKSGPTSVAAFLMEDSTQNTIRLWGSDICRLVREAFKHFVKSGPESVAVFLMEDSTQIQWRESYIRRLVREAFEHFVMSGPEMVGGREQIQEPDRKILQLRFQTSMPAHFFVGKKVEGRAGAICVKLIDATTGHDVASGALSSLTLDVVVLAGDCNNEDDDDWTWEHFKSKVEPSREGKGPLLEGDLQVPLKGGVGLLEDIKFTDISTCRPSGKFRLGVKVETGFFEGIRVREAKTDAFEVKHYKKGSEEKNVPRALDDDVCTLKSIGKNGPSYKNLKDAGIFKVKHFLWKLLFDPEGLRKILGKTMSKKNWKTLRDHAKESVPSGKYHVYYADKTNDSGVVFKNMSELCGLIEDGELISTETLLDNQKVFADNLKKEACAKWKDIVEYDGPLPLEMNPSKRARFSQTDVVTCAPESCPSDIDLASSSYVGPPVNPGLDIGAPVPCQPPSVPSGEASGNSMSDFEDFVFAQLDDLIGLPSSPHLDLSGKADGKTGLDALRREVDRSDSHLPGSSLDPPEQAGGNTGLSFGAHGGHERDIVAPSVWMGISRRCSIPPRRGKVSERKFSRAHGGSFKRGEQPRGSESGKKDEKEEPRGSKSGKKDEKEEKEEKINNRRPASSPMPRNIGSPAKSSSVIKPSRPYTPSVSEPFFRVSSSCNWSNPRPSSE